MYSLSEEKATKFKENLENGEIFLKYEKKTDRIIYLADLPKKKKPKEEEKKAKNSKEEEKKAKKSKEEENKAKNSKEEEKKAKNPMPSPFQKTQKTEIKESIVFLKLNEEPG